MSAIHPLASSAAPRAVRGAALLLLLLGSPPASHAAPGDCTTECWVDAVNGDDATHHGTSASDAFQTIQKAIDTVADGGTVRVAPGLYDPNFTEVPKSVTLLGAQAGVDPLTRDPSDASTESIVQSNTGFWITGPSAQVTIDGFVFKAKTVTSSIGVSAGRAPEDVGASVTVESNLFFEVRISIASSLGENASSFAITGNLFEGGGTGIQMHGDRGPATLLVEDNLFRNATGGAVSLLVWAGAVIRGNTIESQSGPSDAILAGGCTGCTISGNTITSPGGFEAISLIGSDGASTDGMIADNTITSPTRAENYGIYIGQATGTTIARNTITGAREAGIASDPASTITDNQVTSVGGAGTTGIYLRRASTGSTVSGNTVTGAAVGIDVDPQAGSAATHVDRNAIAGNVAGFTNRAATVADATCNWWGDASGPSGQGPGSGDSVSANVTFSPWLLGSDLATATCGLAPTPTPSPSPSPTPAEVCDNCIDDDGDGVVDRADADCPPRADGMGGGATDVKRGRALARCQKTLGGAAPGFVARKQKILAGCVVEVQKCLQLKPGDARCLPKARGKCAKSVAKIAGLEAKLAAGVQKACGALSAAELTAESGLGFAAEAAACAGVGVPALASAADVALCLVRRSECETERLLGVEEPRARELLDVAGVATADFPCLEQGADGGGQGIGSVTRGRALTKCESGLDRAAATFVKQQGAGLRKCIDAVTTCLQQKPADPRCLPKAEKTCTKAADRLAGTKGPAAKARAAIVKSCAGDAADVLAPAGLGHGSTADYCAALGVPATSTAADVAECVVRDHECRVTNLLDASVPRAVELLARGGLLR